MCKREIPRGCVVIRITDLAALIASDPAAAAPARTPEDAWSGLASAVAMLTAHLGRYDVDIAQLADGTDAASIIRPLVIMASAGLRVGFQDQAEEFLQSMGALAATRGRGPDGRLL